MHVDPDQIRAVLDQRAPRRPPSAHPNAATAAVLTPELELLFMRRAEHPADPWSGHVSFPGGRVDPGDATLRDAAVREMLEEFGVDLGQAELLGALTSLEARPRNVTGLTIHPFVYLLHESPRVVPNHEVASVHRLSLDALLAGVGRGLMDYTWQGNALKMPRVDFDGVRLWGLTLAQVDDLLDRLDGQGTGLSRPRQPARNHSATSVA